MGMEKRIEKREIQKARVTRWKQGKREAESSSRGIYLAGSMENGALAGIA